MGMEDIIPIILIVVVAIGGVIYIKSRKRFK